MRWESRFSDHGHMGIHPSELTAVAVGGRRAERRSGLCGRKTRGLGPLWLRYFRPSEPESP
eukprot:2453027-Rhodomonas_salina.3